MFFCQVQNNPETKYSNSYKRDIMLVARKRRSDFNFNSYFEVNFLLLFLGSGPTVHLQPKCILIV